MTDGPGEALDRATFERLVEMTGGDLEFIDELVDTYLDDGATQIAALEAAAAAGSVEDLVRPAHSLKGSSLNIGALGLGELSRGLEEAARGGGAVDGAGAAVAAIAAAFGEVRAALLAEREGRAAG